MRHRLSMFTRTPVRAGIATAALLFAPGTTAFAQTGENVAVVINETSAESVRIGEYYAKIRKLPPDNVIRIRTTEEERIERAAYRQTIEQPVENALFRHNLQDRVLYLVLTKGVPLRIEGTVGRQGTVSSVDSELTLLYRRMTGRHVPVTGPIPNPYFLDARPVTDARPFTHRDHDIYLVARLDGFSVDDVIALIDRAQTPSADGSIVLDQRSNSTLPGDGWLREAATRLRAQGHGSRVILEETKDPVRNIDNVFGYYSWGSNDPANRVRSFGMRFVPGALAATLTSHDARTFKAPPNQWVPGSEAMGPSTWFAGSPQSLTGDLLREGITGVAGNVAEPFLDGAVRPEILFPAYLGGFNLIEAFYLGLPHLSWQTVIVGDPLCAPARKAVMTSTQNEEPMDPQTELPGLFGKRRVEAAGAAAKDLPLDAVVLIVKADSRVRRGDIPGTRQALEEATALAPQAVAAQLQLAQMLEASGEFNQATVRYRHVLKYQPDTVLALNNLAYTLAVRNKAPKEGLPLARRAATLASDDPTVIDTLAWIEHLLGNDIESLRLFRSIVQKSTGNAEIHLHAAIVYASSGDRVLAAAQLRQALLLDTTLDARDDVKVLRAQLASK